MEDLKFNDEKQQQRVVLIGTIGYGKTTLFNRLTGTSQIAQSGGESATRIIVKGVSKAEQSKKSFEVFDTPGLGSSQDKIQHIAGILAALKQNIVHRIIFAILHERTDLMINQIRSIFKFFKNYKENITIYISQFGFFKEMQIKKKINIKHPSYIMIAKTIRQKFLSKVKKIVE